MARRPVFDGPVAAGVGGDVAADEARVAAARIAGVEETFLFGRFLQVRRAYTRFDDGIEAVFIDFQYLFHLFQRQDDAAVFRDGAAGQTRAGPAGDDREVAGIGQLDDGADLLGCFGKDDGFGHVMVSRVGHFVMGIRLHGVGVGDDVFRADDGL